MIVQDNANASPTKAFFVEMLVKDVSLESAILDLVDNAIDGARRLHGDGPYDDNWIHLQVDENEFVIEDNCGGMELEMARNYAFRFGRDPAMEPLKSSIGAFGVGMKRAIFKIGADINVSSSTATHAFEVVVNVPAWLAPPEPETDTNQWHFPMDWEELTSPPPADEQGTKIKITNLNKPVTAQFGSPYFPEALRKIIAARHQQYIDRGLVVMVNNISVTGASVQFAYRSVGDLKPAYELSQLDGVTVRLYAGVGVLKRAEAGWNIFCNGRMIVEKDQSELTGWGESTEVIIPKFHHQFARFRGCVFFDSETPGKLPWNTTKDGIDVASDVFRTTKVRMVRHMRSVIDFLNRVDKEFDEPDESKHVLMALLDHAEYAPSWNVPTAAQFTFVERSVERLPETTRITIRPLKTDIERAKDCLGVSSGKQAVEKILDWYLENQCSDTE